MDDTDLLRLVTIGSVDDGKSTLIGRLLYDSKTLLQDTWEAVERSSLARGDQFVNLALVTDGLRAEREQHITIDVAYRYFATARRKFVIADTPGHVQYTRNMVTGASTAHLALILVDARHGPLEQSRRHATIAALLGIPHLVICVNKMDLVGFDQDVFESIRDEFSTFVDRLRGPRATFIPISALLGDNVVTRSERMPWYDGEPLLSSLEEVAPGLDENLDDARFPVQYVIRPQREDGSDYRGCAGTVAGGIFRPGDPVRVLPSGVTTRIAAVDTYDGPQSLAAPPMAVTLRLADDVDASRGDMIVGVGRGPYVSRDLSATICWMAEGRPLTPGTRLVLKHTTRTTRAVVDRIDTRLDVNTLQDEVGASQLAVNEIGRVGIRTMTPLVFDPYARNRRTGSFILIDEVTNNTVAAGMMLDVCE